MRTRGKEKAGKQRALAGGSAQLSRYLDRRSEISGRCVEPLNSGRFTRNSIRQKTAEGFIEPLLDLFRVRGEVELTPVQRLGSVHHDFDSPCDCSMRIEREIGGMGGDGVLEVPSTMYSARDRKSTRLNS